MKKDVLKKRVLTSAVLIFFIFLIFKSIYFMVLALLIFGTISILEFLNLTKKIFKRNVFNYTVNFFYIFFLSIFSISFFYLYNFQHTKLILFILLAGCVASDIGGYVFGNIFKGPKLTKISPKKTISGALGSLIFTCVIILSLIYIETNFLNFSIFIVSLVTSISCQFGDLFFSFLKRKAKLKDTGNLLPGHGGVLDRLDGIFFGIPFGFLTLILLFK